MRFPRHLLAVFLVLAAGSGPACADVDLDAKQRDNLGIKTERAQTLTRVRTWPAAAQVLDVAPLVGLLSDLRSAETAAAASAGELARTEQLHRTETNVALKAVEAARSQAAVDAGHVATIRSQLLAGWGASVASLSAPARQRLLEELLAGRGALVRAEPTASVPAGVRIGRAQLQSIDESRTWPAELIGSLPQTGAPSIAGAFLVRVATNLPAGQMLIATLEESGGGVRALTVPAAAIVRWHGAEWIFEETRPNHFERRAIASGASIGGRVAITGEPHSSPQVVTIGSRALLAAEQGAPAGEQGAPAED